MEENHNEKNFDIIVIGAGHAGVEAALAGARMKKRVLLLTISLDSISFMACNPNIGGTAKGHLVREIDALGGQMGVAADSALIQLRMLNMGKGAAVHSLRGQTDKALYHANMKHVVELTDGITLLQAEVTEVLARQGKVCGIKTAMGDTYFATAVIICTGVYLQSDIIVGEYVQHSGPNGFQRAGQLSQSLSSLGLTLRRFKTGTPARVKKSTIDFEKMQPQFGDEDIYSFSALSGKLQPNVRECYLTYTTEATHKLLRDNIALAPMYNGGIHGVGPRYCPSIEDKVMRFADKERHQVFIEPEGLNTEEYYVQGISTSMPISIQQQLYRTIIGLEKVEIMRYAYAIEYDCLDPLELTPTLMTKKIGGLFSAGQMNGSSGYEEAAAQGLMAGINAVRYIDGKDGVILQRSLAYIGVLIDDLVTKGTNEPYRMMTARAEYRLYLRQDNADLRLTQLGRDIGLVSDERYAVYTEKLKQMKQIEQLLDKYIPFSRYEKVLQSVDEQPTSGAMSFRDLFKRANVDARLMKNSFSELEQFDISALISVELENKYDGYIKKQLNQIKEAERLEQRLLPADIDYLRMDGLRLEARQKLYKIRPASVGQASRISGVSPSDITVLLLALRQEGGNG